MTRRSVIGSAAGAMVALSSGCVQRARNLFNRRSGTPIALTIKTVPADEDRATTEIARLLASQLTAVGIDAEVVLEVEEELRRNVLVNHAFDVYVGRSPEQDDPDRLRPLLHARFNGEPGWQNPFGFTDLAVDELLTGQRQREGADRQSVVWDLQRAFARQQPFTVIGFEEEIRVVRTGRFEGWMEFPLYDPLSYLALRLHEADDATSGRGRRGDDPSRLRVTITDDRVTKNFNPIAVEYRNRGTFVGLLYDPLARRFDGAVRPWLAEDWSWNTDGGTTTAIVRLRDDLRWHDGHPLTATDVAFTYRFLSDTTLGERDAPVPAPRFRGRTSLVQAVEPIDDRRLRFEFDDTVPEVAVRAFTVPMLPISEWEPRAISVDVIGLDLFDGVTEALVWENPEPVGSGPLRYGRKDPEERLVLQRFDDHFLDRDTPEAFEERFDGPLAFDELVARVVPSDAAAVELIQADEADATASSTRPSVALRGGRSDELEVVVDRSRAFYHVGFNARRPPLSNQRFRRAVARLLDKPSIANGVFEGYFRPAAVPIAGREWTPPDLRWDGEDPEVPFVGEDGDLDVESARAMFLTAGYQYDEEGRLVSR